MSYRTEHEKKIEKNLAKLPELCHVAVPGEKVLCIVKRGESGYYKTDWPVGDDKFAEEFAAERNKKMGVTPAQASAMVNGSMVGWHVPAADPDNEINRMAK